MTPIDHFKQSARAALAIYSDTYFTRKGAGVGKAEALDALTAAAVEYLEAEIERRVALKIGELEAIRRRLPAVVPARQLSQGEASHE